MAQKFVANMIVKQSEGLLIVIGNYMCSLWFRFETNEGEIGFSVVYSIVS